VSDDRWHTVKLEGHSVQLLNLDHPSVREPVIGDIDVGIDVYDDSRWKATKQFGRLLYDQPEWVAGKSVLVVGAGVGLETVVVGSLCERLYINDLSPVSLRLCLEQLDRIHIARDGVLEGRYEEVTLPNIDLVVGCFVVYEREARSAMEALLAKTDVPVLLVNEKLDAFQGLMGETDREVERMGMEDGPTVVVLRSLRD